MFLDFSTTVKAWESDKNLSQRYQLSKDVPEHSFNGFAGSKLNNLLFTPNGILTVIIAFC